MCLDTYYYGIVCEGKSNLERERAYTLLSRKAFLLRGGFSEKTLKELL